jgi:hypothetical protein
VRLATDGRLQDLRYGYDAAGNATSLFDAVIGVNLSYEYDYRTWCRMVLLLWQNRAVCAIIDCRLVRMRV